MVQTCYRCAAQFAEDVRFCPQCGAAQIRVPVAVSEPEQPSAPDLLTSAANFSVTGSGGLARHKWRSILPPAIILGLVTPFVLSLLKLAYFFIAASAGFMSVVLYRNHAGPQPVTSGEGVRLGALTGFISFVVSAILMLAVLGISSATGGLHAEFENAVHAAESQAPDPQTQALMHRFLTPEGMALLIVISLALLLFLQLGSCLIGGLLGAMGSGRRQN